MDPNFQVYWYPDDEISSVSELSTSLDELVNVISAKSHRAVVIIENDPEKLKLITRKLMQVAKPGSFLKEIHFRSIFGINDAGYHSISMELTDSSVIRLGLGSTKVGCAGMKYICDHLQKYTNITQLDLEYLSEKGVACILANIKELNISWLSFNGAIISKHLYHKLFQMLKNNQTIKTFGFPESSDNYDVQFKLHYWLEDCFQENFTLDSLIEFTCDSYSLVNFIQLYIKWFLERNKICKEMKASKPQGNTISHYMDIKDIPKFLVDIQKNSEELRVMKLMVLGDRQIGKTTLLNAMKSILREKYQEFSNIVNTMEIDFNSLQLARGELSVWDFSYKMKYIATPIFLSFEIAVVFICFNLQTAKDEQMRQIAFWFDFLNSNLSLPPLSTDKFPKWTIILIGVCADKQYDFTLTEDSTNIIKIWKTKWPRLPIASTIFSVSSLTSTQSVQQLLQFVTIEVNHIFDAHAVQIPSTYHQFLFKLKTFAQNNFLVHWQQLYTEFKDDIKYDKGAFKAMLQYCHSIGKIICLPTEYVFTDPTLLPKIVTKFISPTVSLILLKNQDERVEILDETEVESLLKIDITDNKRFSQELELIVHLKICFPFKTADSNELLYLFPSLSSSAEANKLQFQKYLYTLQTMTGICFIASNSTIFVQEFFYQLLVTLFQTLNIYRGDIKEISENGAVIQCPGLFFGEMLIMLDFYQQSIIVAMSASDIGTEYASAVFNSLVEKEFPQYTESKQEILCETCLKLCFIDAQLPIKNIGVFRSNEIICSTQQHQKISQFSIQCKEHNKSEHNIFINYTVKTEGIRSQFSSVEPFGGAVEYLFSSLAVQKTKVGNPISVFWDKKCFNDSYSWEQNFLHGLINSEVVLLLISNQALALIVKNAQQQHDNVLFEYEVALLLYKRFEVPVFPIFLAELAENKSTLFYFNHQFPDVSHKRDKSAQNFIDALSVDLLHHEIEFLGSIKQTINEIFKIQGVFMKERFESKEEMNNLIQRILSKLKKAPFVSFRHISTLLSKKRTILSFELMSKKQMQQVDKQEQLIDTISATSLMSSPFEKTSTTVISTSISSSLDFSSSTTINICHQKPSLFFSHDILMTPSVLAVGVTAVVVVGALVWAIYSRKS